jgi:hypothetical protein
MEFLSPLGWLVAIAALVPVAAVLLRGRSDRRVRELLRLPSPGLGTRAAVGIAAALAICLLAAATARPALRSGSTQRVRTDAQIYYVLDISRSMLARQPKGQTRFDRAVAAVEKLRSALGDVPSGIASLTDRPLPHVFPTGNRAVFSSVLHKSIGIQRPPPGVGEQVRGVITTYDTLTQLASAEYFSPSARHRLAILLTDGESDVYNAGAVARELRAGHVGLLVVRFWHPDERVITNGRVEDYRPNRLALRPLKELGSHGLGVYGETDLAGAEHAARGWLGSGPTTATGRAGRLELAPYTALAAIVPLAFILWRRDP